MRISPQKNLEDRQIHFAKSGVELGRVQRWNTPLTNESANCCIHSSNIEILGYGPNNRIELSELKPNVNLDIKNFQINSENQVNRYLENVLYRGVADMLSVPAKQRSWPEIDVVGGQDQFRSLRQSFGFLPSMEEMLFQRLQISKGFRGSTPPQPQELCVDKNSQVYWAGLTDFIVKVECN